MKKAVFPILFTALILLSCTPTPQQPTEVAMNPRPTIELISPPSGLRILIREEIEVESRSADESGLERIELWLDDSIYRVDPADGQQSFHVIQRWRADEAGEHELRVQAFDVDGQVSQPAIVRVEAIDPASLTPTPTGTPADTPSPMPTPTWTATAVPSSTPTATLEPQGDRATATVTATTTPTATVEATATTPVPSQDMVLIPAGKFVMGSNEDAVQQAADWCHCPRSRFEDELYLHEVYVSDFYIDKYEVTNQQYMAFIQATDYQTDAEKRSEARTWRTEFTPGKEKHPVVWMTWNDAHAYCQWAGKRLPTEAEWEKAARGTDARLWPWGNNWDSALVNMGEGRRKTTTPVGSFPAGASPYGVMDMGGNVWEWVNDWYDHAYYRGPHDRDPVGPDGGEDRVLRGGAFNNAIQDVRAANRHKGGQAGYAPDHGFRCAR